MNSILTPFVEWKCKENLFIKSEIENMAQLLQKELNLGSYGWLLFLIMVILRKFHAKVKIC